MPVPRIVEKIVLVPQIIEKCVVVERPHLEIIEIEREVPIVHKEEVAVDVEVIREVLKVENEVQIV